MRVYRIQARRASDELVDFVLSMFDEGRLGNTFPVQVSENTSVRGCFSDVMYAIEEDGIAEFRVEVNRHDGGNMENGATCLVCGWIGCDTPFAIPGKVSQ